MLEKFRLDDSDENAEIHFLGLLEESINSLFSKVTDKLHFWASYMRKWLLNIIKFNSLMK